MDNIDYLGDEIDDEEVIDFTKLKYVLYARKSSEDEGAQEKSLPDQIAECEAFAAKNHLNVVDIIKEQKSAKISNNRPLFSQMLKDIKNEKYDAILAWHPDRLARNSLESGMIIDMLDNGIIKDIRMPTTAFENNASGKLLLNILFAMSKEYSEHLSESVLRAHKRNIKQGISSGTPKWGYSRDNATGRYEPDDNFEIIKRGWEMRAEGSTISEIMEFWSKRRVSRNTKITRKNKVSRLVYLGNNKATVANIFRDPFYYGLLIQSGKKIVLSDHYNFEPMVSEETYNKVQALSRSRLQTTPTAKGKVFLPFRGLVVCGSCHKPMTVGASGRKNEKKLYYECRNKSCKNRQTVRARIILDALYEQLDGIKFSEIEYALFRSRVKEITAEKKDELLTELSSLKGSRTAIKKEFNDLSEGLALMQKSSSKIPEAIKSVEKKLESKRDQLTDIESDISKLEEQVKDESDITATEKDFLNIVNSVSDKMRAGTPVQKDELARLILLNIVIGNKKEPHFLWKEPFDAIVKRSFVQTGAPD